MLGLSKDGLVDIFQESVGEVLVPQNVLNDLGGFALDENFNIFLIDQIEQKMRKTMNP